MKVAVVGLWHLGIVTAACLAKAGHEVMGFDPDKAIVANLQKGIAPIFEPGLDDLLQLMSKNLTYSNDPADIEQSDIVWVSFDTPVDDNDNADVQFVIHEIEKIAPFIKRDALVLISSQIPVGSTRKIIQYFTALYPHKNIRFGYIPENLRLGKAISVFTQADRFVVGLQSHFITIKQDVIQANQVIMTTNHLIVPAKQNVMPAQDHVILEQDNSLHQNDKNLIQELLGTFTERFVWTSIESAEMTKHALNAFLAVSVTFINEIASLCEKVGADASEVEAGLKSEERIGQKAYLRAGGAIAGGTLLRDINYLDQISKAKSTPAPLLSSVLNSNSYHKDWVQRKIQDVVSQLKNKTVAILGLTYKANTNTLRRSSSVETCQWLYEQGARVHAFDPAIQTLPDDYSQFIHLKSSVEDALQSADVIVVATEWPDFRQIMADAVLNVVKHPIILDANGFLLSTLGQDPRVRYCSVGRIG